MNTHCIIGLAVITAIGVIVYIMMRRGFNLSKLYIYFLWWEFLIREYVEKIKKEFKK